MPRSTSSCTSSSRMTPAAPDRPRATCRASCRLFSGRASHVAARSPSFIAASLLATHLAREEIALHEIAERRADAVLARRHDGRVRDGNAQRMPEERGHGEPVGDAAHHRGLGKGAHVAQPRKARLVHAREHEQDATTTSIAVATRFIRTSRTRLISSSGVMRSAGGRQVDRRAGQRGRGRCIRSRPPTSCRTTCDQRPMRCARGRSPTGRRQLECP